MNMELTRDEFEDLTTTVRDTLAIVAFGLNKALTVLVEVKDE